MRPATGFGADAAKNAAEVLRQYIERAGEILDPMWRAGVRMGRGEAEGGDETKVEHPMPPYGVLHAESDQGGDESDGGGDDAGGGERRKKKKKRAPQANQRRRQGGHQQQKRKRGRSD